MSKRDTWLTCDESLLVVRLDFHKGAGNGGQKINKTSSAVRITHPESGITTVCNESRSQTRNRQLAIRKLRKRMALELRCEPEMEVNAKDIPALTNERYYLYLAQVLDHLQKTGSVPGFTRSGLERFLRRDPEVWRYLSEHKTMEYGIYFGVRTCSGDGAPVP